MLKNEHPHTLILPAFLGIVKDLLIIYAHLRRKLEFYARLCYNENHHRAGERRQMFEEERQIRIMNEMSEHRSMTVGELAAILRESGSTVRRALTRMEGKGLIRRTHGGAMVVEEVANSLSRNARRAKDGEIKGRIARCAAELVADGETILLNSSSITERMPAFLTAKNITVITNSLYIARELSEREACVLILLGGVYLKKVGTIEGPTTVGQITGMKYDKAFIGVNGIDRQFGLSTASELEAATKIAALAQARQSYCLCEHTKFEKTALYKLCPLENIHCVITDAGLDPELLRAYREHTQIKIAR